MSEAVLKEARVVNQLLTDYIHSCCEGGSQESVDLTVLEKAISDSGMLALSLGAEENKVRPGSTPNKVISGSTPNKVISGYKVISGSKPTCHSLNYVTCFTSACVSRGSWLCKFTEIKL